MDNRGSILDRDVQTSFSTQRLHLRHYRVCTNGSLSGIKLPEREADHLTPPVTKVWMWERFSMPPIHLHGLMLRHNNFTFSGWCLFRTAISELNHKHQHTIWPMLPQFSNHALHIPLATYCLMRIRHLTPSFSSEINSPWRWQLQCLPKRWKRFNIRRGSFPKALVMHEIVLFSRILQ
jgi:hypothetical protein